MRSTVDVLGLPVEVEMNQKSQAVWIAVGEVQGHRVEGKGRTRVNALARWLEAAAYHAG